MTPDPLSTTEALLESLLEAPPLVGDLPEATTLGPSHLAVPSKIEALNFAQKLGHLYEDALAVLLDNSPKFDLLERNLQIQKDIHTTVGELDFLIRDCESKSLIHLELATKFYLAVETENGLTLPGPDARDNYFRKIARLREHQLQLPTRFRDFIPTPYRDEKIITRQLINGCLFDHIDSAHPAEPEFINPNCRRGKWLHQSEIPHHFPSLDHFKIIPKALWPVPLELMRGIPLEIWNPEQDLERCLMVRHQHNPTPYFLAPDHYGLAHDLTAANQVKL